MITASGIWVDTDYGAPTIDDVAIQLSRINRFAGAIGPWSVLNHSLLVWKLVHYFEVQQPWLQLPALIHDAAESIVGDVPSFLKTPEAKMLETKIMIRILEEWNIDVNKMISRFYQIRRYDLMALDAEARHFELPNWKDIGFKKHHFDFVGGSGLKQLDSLLHKIEKYNSVEVWKQHVKGLIKVDSTWFEDF